MKCNNIWKMPTEKEKLRKGKVFEPYFFQNLKQVQIDNEVTERHFTPFFIPAVTPCFDMRSRSDNSTLFVLLPPRFETSSD